MAQARVPGPIGLRTTFSGIDTVIPRRVDPTRGGTVPGPTGLHLADDETSAQPTGGSTAKPKALIIIGAGQDGIKRGVRHNSDAYYDKAALKSFAQFTGTHAVTMKHVSSAKTMKALIESSTWDVVIYFGHGVENMQALNPGEGGKLLSKAELVAALQKAQTTKLYLFGCKAGQTGLARALSKDLPGTTVYGTFGSLDVDWEQKMDAQNNFTNEFIFKESLTQYTGGFQTRNGVKTKQRRHEQGDKIKIDPNAAPLDDKETMVDQ